MKINNSVNKEISSINQKQIRPGSAPRKKISHLTSNNSSQTTRPTSAYSHQDRSKGISAATSVLTTKYTTKCNTPLDTPAQNKFTSLVKSDGHGTNIKPLYSAFTTPEGEFKRINNIKKYYDKVYDSKEKTMKNKIFQPTYIETFQSTSTSTRKNSGSKKRFSKTSNSFNDFEDYS